MALAALTDALLGMVTFGGSTGINSKARRAGETENNRGEGENVKKIKRLRQCGCLGMYCCAVFIWTQKHYQNTVVFRCARTTQHSTSLIINK